MKSILAIMLVLNLVYFGQGCTKTSEPSDVSDSLTAYLRLSVVQTEGVLPLNVQFILAPSFTTTNQASSDSVKIRWDYDNDGSWDSGFQQLGIVNNYQPASLPSRDWSARCEIEDGSGCSAIAEATISLPDWLPAPPDIVLGEMLITDFFGFSSDRDTVMAGEQFHIVLTSRNWADQIFSDVEVDYLIDGVRVSTLRCLIPGAFYPRNAICVQDSFRIFETGTHLVEALVDPNNEYMETNESNNHRARTIVVVGIDSQ